MATNFDWSVTSRFGIPLFINAGNTQFPDGSALDVETDEKDNFVGIGVYSGAGVYYWSNGNLAKQITLPKFVGHNGKFDLWQLKKWGFNVNSSFLMDDTIIASYVVDVTRKSHSLKDYAVELGMPYPRYEDIVGKGAKRKTLDKQPLDLVANYNACDCVATYKLWEKFQKEMTQEQREYYDQIEMPIYRLCYKMQEMGVKLDRSVLLNAQFKFSKEIEELKLKLQDYLGEDFNPNSPKQVTERLFQKFGIQFENTNKETLSKRKMLPLIVDLLRYKKVNKLVSTYIKPYIEAGAELHPEYNQVAYSKESKTEEGIRTGRLSSRNPNFQNLPSKTEEGMVIRSSVIPSPGSTFVLADYSQIELRVLAHFCKDRRMVMAFKEDRDIHDETATAIGCSRDIAKTINFALVYGSGPWNLSQKANISLIGAQKFLEKFDKQFPAVHDWKQKTLYEAQKNGYVKTLIGRSVKWEIWPNCKKHSLKTINKGKPCGGDCQNRLEAEANRRAISAVIQGSAAEIIKLAMLKLDVQGFKFPVTEHDALLFEIKAIDVFDLQQIKDTMENVVQLGVPLKVELYTGKSWGYCKSQ